MTTPSPQWKKTACILCSLNCGLEVQTENGRISKIRGDDDHPASQGYVCEKSQRMDYYQNGADRLDTPMRRRPDGSYEAIDWDTAIREVAEKFLAIKRRHGGESILYYGGGAQGNHLGGAYGDSTLKALGVKYRSNALAQEKTGEFWVQGKMFGTGVHGDFEHCEVAILIGKNPWQSHGFARARVLLNAMAKDPARSIIVIDPRLSETAALADFHLQIRPGTDAWCLAALVGIIVQDGLLARDWLAEHTSGYEHIVDELNAIPVAYCAETCGVAEDKLRAAARRIASASSVSALEDLGMQMNLHSTLGSYLQRLVWLLTGHYGRPGTSNAFVPFLSLSKASKGDTSMGKKGAPRVEKRSPVANAKIIIGLIPCNVIPEEILTDHPKRYRAMLVETGNPLHSLADSQRMREAMRALELSVVIDVAMTETARHADYVLPAASQFEKAEATFFNLEFPRNAFHLRAPLFPARPGTLPEAEIHARLLEAMGVLGEKDYRPLRLALKLGRKAFSAAFLAAAATRPKVMKYAPVLLYRTLGPTLPAGMEAAAAIWGICQLHVLNNRKTAARAGFDGLPPLAADRLFQAMLDNPVRGGLRRNHLRRKLAGRRPSRTADQPAHPRTVAGTGQARPQRATPRSGLPVHPRRRRAAQRHQQYRRARHRLAPPRALRHPAHQPAGRRGAGLRRRRGAARGDPPRRGRGGSGDQRHDAAGQYLPAQRPGPGLPQRRGRGGAPGRGAQRGDRLHPARLPRRHALAQVRAGAPGTAGDARRYERLSQGGRS